MRELFAVHPPDVTERVQCQVRRGRRRIGLDVAHSAVDAIHCEQVRDVLVAVPVVEGGGPEVRVSEASVYVEEAGGGARTAHFSWLGVVFIDEGGSFRSCSRCYAATGRCEYGACVDNLSVRNEGGDG